MTVADFAVMMAVSFDVVVGAAAAALAAAACKADVVTEVGAVTGRRASRAAAGPADRDLVVAVAAYKETADHNSWGLLAGHTGDPSTTQTQQR